MTTSVEHGQTESFRIVPTSVVHAQQLEQLQKLVFPTLSESSLFKTEHYLHHLKVFPEGQFVALVNEIVVGMTTTIRYHLDGNNQHSFNDILDGGFLNTHQPDGDWLYGLDIGTHPHWRAKGIASALYESRQKLVEQLNLKGQYTYGMLTGYGALKAALSAESYYEQVTSGKLKDPTVSRQIAFGFEAIKLVQDYVDDPVCDGYCVLLVRRNKKFRS
ncbi:MAG: GNAT family N-acetyltransferase [Bacteroidetes bacterium]|nr:GNAT family N-acetyltransferase [Bacteroidota bacterium]